MPQVPDSGFRGLFTAPLPALAHTLKSQFFKSPKDVRAGRWGLGAQPAQSTPLVSPYLIRAAPGHMLGSNNGDEECPRPRVRAWLAFSGSCIISWSPQRQLWAHGCHSDPARPGEGALVRLFSATAPGVSQGLFNARSPVIPACHLLGILRASVPNVPFQRGTCDLF